MATIRATPGVYIAEKNAFPNSIVPVNTAVPAFIGYTEKALNQQRDLRNKPIRISSLGEYRMFFGEAPPTAFQLSATPGQVPAYHLQMEPAARFLLYSSLKLFFANGGSACYIVSVGGYEAAPSLADFEAGSLEALKKEQEPTLLLAPDAVCLGAIDCGKFQRQMLEHCQSTGRCFAILDVFTDENAPPSLTDDVAVFRTNIGSENLAWGAAYYPWLHTVAEDNSSVDFTRFNAASQEVLKQLLQVETSMLQANGSLSESAAAGLQAEITKIGNVKDADIKALHQTLSAASAQYRKIMADVLQKLNFLPPGGAIAGVYCMVDNQQGVFHAPANISLNGVSSLALNITNAQQEDMNTPLDGKAVNAIRNFIGKGPLIWGARTLDGNSQDWRYINVRRSMIFVEQSIKLALQAYVFSPNNAEPWTSVRAMVETFLMQYWQQGGLAGATAKDAFSVSIGLGSSMTPEDILAGRMRMTIMLAVSRPAEFIVITLEQMMAQG